MSSYILSHTKIATNCLWHNGKLISKNDERVSSAALLEGFYKSINLSYPKFFKMDALSKLGILCAELILKDENINDLFAKEKTAIVLSNKNSSLQTDVAYAKTMADFPSPALFVYTLPNIVTGEIAIKHKITGENAFFIEPIFNAELLHNYAELILQENDAALCGWLNIDETTCEGFLYFVAKQTVEDEKKTNFITHNSQNITNLYIN
ncbi:MAG: 3-oxoacyl-ACP synthase [Bacteroidia bacterium]